MQATRLQLCGAARALRKSTELKGLGKLWPLFNGGYDPAALMKEGYQHERLMSLYVGPAQCVIATHPETAREVLSRPKDFVKVAAREEPSIQDALYMMNDGKTRGDVLGANGQHWASMRKMINPAFASAALTELIPIFEEQVDKLVARWEEKGETTANINGDMKHFALDVLGAAVLGTQMNSLGGGMVETYDAYTTIMKATQEPLYMAFPSLEKLPTKRNKNLRASVDHMLAFLKKAVDDRKADRANGVVRARRDVMDMLMPDENGEGGLPEDSLLPNLWIFFLAGHDTTAISLAWVLHALAEYPEVQQRARQEAEEVMREVGDRGMTAADLDRLKYISAVIDESLRLHPPVYNLMTRQAAQETELDGYLLPKNTLVSIHVGAVNRHPTVWEDGHKFDPLRFLDQKAPRVFHYLPFSAGPRRCVGDRFSLYEQKLLLLKLLPKFSLHLPSDTARGADVELDTDNVPLVFHQPKAIKLRVTPI